MFLETEYTRTRNLQIEINIIRLKKLCITNYLDDVYYLVEHQNVERFKMN